MTFLCIYIVFPIYSACASWWIERNGWTERTFFVAAVSTIHSVMYFGQNGMFLYWDRNGIFERYKLDRTPIMGPTQELLNRTWKEAIVGQFLSGPVVLYFLHPVFKYFGTPDALAPLPEFWDIFRLFVFAQFFNGFFFYWTHRLVHSKPLYAWIHKQHHTHIGTVGFSAEYAHPIEQILSNQGPTIGGCLLSGAHICLTLFWIQCRLYQTYETHSGYCFYGTWLHKIGLTYAEGAAYHDFHHTGNRGNFGGPEYLDYFFGTLDAWHELGGCEGYIRKKRSGNILNNAFRAKYEAEKRSKLTKKEK